MTNPPTDADTPSDPTFGLRARVFSRAVLAPRPAEQGCPTRHDVDAHLQNERRLQASADACQRAALDLGDIADDTPSAQTLRTVVSFLREAAGAYERGARQARDSARGAMVLVQAEEGLRALADTPGTPL